MGHDASKIQLGVPSSSHKVVDNHKGVIPPGKIVRLKSDDTLSIAAADGSPLGISVGEDQSDIGRTAICRKGSLVPVLLTAAFDPVIGTQVNISDTTGVGIASGGGATAMNAVWASERKTAINEDGTENALGAAYIDMVGGL